MMNDRDSITTARFALCLRDGGYPASLEPRKLYDALPDPAAERRGMIRVVDESGEDYLFPRSGFLELPPELSAAIGRALRRAS
ncbi:MAG TPA: hypothetical protein VHG91_15025 [Longimicrobium sp.]|nr:hypothetical protein [Longimicrobium sp.]